MGGITKLFWNADERRLRVGWRLSIQFALFVVMQLLAFVAEGSSLVALLEERFPWIESIADNLLLAVVYGVGVLLCTWLVTRWIDHRSFSDLGLAIRGQQWVDFGFGLLLGALLMTLIFLVEWRAGWVTVRGFWQVQQPGIPFARAILGPLLVFLAVGVVEELLSRGYQLRNLAETMSGLGERPALLLAWLFSSIFFGLIHLLNANSTIISTVALVAAGLFLGLGRLYTGSLAIPIGLHITWNFFQGNVYGFPVSGNLFTEATVIAIAQGGPKAWTGADFGPEAGLIGISAILLGTLLTLLWVRWRTGQVALQRTLARYLPRVP